MTFNTQYCHPVIVLSTYENRGEPILDMFIQEKHISIFCICLVRGVVGDLVLMSSHNGHHEA